MDAIGLFYASDWGNTEKVARLIKEEFGDDIVELYDLALDDMQEIEKYDELIFGISTADEHNMQKDWLKKIDELDHLDIEGKTVALFGLGDQKEWPNYFADALGLLYKKVKANGADVIGTWPTEGYEFKQSKALVDGAFVGLVIDEDNQKDLTYVRIKNWVKKIKAEL